MAYRPMEDIEAELAKGTPYVVRFRSEGSIEHKVRHEDLVKGKMGSYRKTIRTSSFSSRTVFRPITLHTLWMTT